MAHFLQLYQGKTKIIAPELGRIKNIPKDRPIRVLHDTVPDLFKLKSLNGSNIKSFAEQTISFSMVRHPFERYKKRIRCILFNIKSQISVGISRQAYRPKL